MKIKNKKLLVFVILQFMILFLLPTMVLSLFLYTKFPEYTILNFIGVWLFRIMCFIAAYFLADFIVVPIYKNFVDNIKELFDE